MSNRAIPPLLAPRESEPLWIEPSQARSRARVERILAAARELLGEHGLVGLTMDAVARRADIPIGSLYQFFPDRNALIARLFHAQLMATDALVMEALSGARSMAELRKILRPFPGRYTGTSRTLRRWWKSGGRFSPSGHSATSIPTTHAVWGWPCSRPFGGRRGICRRGATRQSLFPGL
ncbi:TetR/AcrR family transcriptional regulator [Microbulbifer taiwanensis]